MPPMMSPFRRRAAAIYFADAYFQITPLPPPADAAAAFDCFDDAAD